MATLNPLEQKARSSFIKGFIVAIFIGLIIAGFLGMQLFQAKGKEKQRIAGQVQVMILTQDIKSGDLISSDMMKSIKVDADVATAAAASSFSDLSSYFLKDTNGNDIVTERDKNGNEILTITIAAETQNKNGGKYTVSQDDNGTYYYKDASGATQYIKLDDTALVSKIDLTKNTIVTKDMFTESNEQTTDDLREQEYNMVVLPSNLATNDTIDIRLRLPSGVDYIVVSKKKVTIPESDSTSGANTMFIKLTEDETLTMSAAIVDAYKISGSKLYANKYTDPGIQKTASQTYIPSSDTLQLISKNPNIVDTAKAALISFYNENYDAYRSGVASALNKSTADDQKSAVEQGTSTETSTQSQLRQSYLQSLSE